MKNVFVGLICRLDMAKGRIGEIEDKSKEMTQTKTQREKRVESKTEQNRKSKNCGAI